MAVRSARGITFVVAAIALALAAGSASTVPGAAAPTWERVWGDGREWEAQLGTLAVVHGRWQPFYLIAPIDAAHPQSRGHWGFGPHDHVMNVPPHVQGAGTGPCRALLVVPGPNGVAGGNIDVVPDPDLGIPFVRAADIDGDGIPELLTSVATTEYAEALGLVAFFEPQPGGYSIEFRCPLRPLR